MTRLPIVKIGNPVLRKKCGKVGAEMLQDPKLRKFLEGMVVTMRQAEGVGLAANQVGQGIQAIVLESRENARYPKAPSFPLEIYLNPKILKYSHTKEEDWEGCLSIPGYRGRVPRAREVTFEALTPEGKTVRATASGFHARVIQHEVDHINGFFYMDRMPDLKSWMHLEEFNHLLKREVRER